MGWEGGGKKAVLDCNWVWILDIGFWILDSWVLFFFFLSPFDRERRRHLHQRRAWTHRFRAPAWAVRLLANDVMIYDTEAGRTAGLSVLAFIGFLFSEEGVCWEGGTADNESDREGDKAEVHDCNYTINFFPSIKTLYHSVPLCSLPSRKSTNYSC